MRLIDADKLMADCGIYNAWDAKIVKAWLDDQPTVNAVPVVHGKWRLTPMANGRYLSRKCSLCGDTFGAISAYKSHQFGVPAYCPNCGARMDGKTDETDFRSYGEQREDEN